MKGALIGFGFIGSQGHFPAYLEMPGVQMVAIVDGSQERLQLVRKTHPHIRVYSDVATLFAQETHLDFVDICTPPSTHFSLAKEAIQRGIHVLCEKPLTVTDEQTEQLLELSQKHQVVIFPCHNYKHAPIVQAMKKVIDANEVGAIRFVTLTTFRSTHAKGVSSWEDNWRRQANYSGGGIVMDHGYHNFYLTFMFLKSFPTAVTAKTFCLDPQYTTEDNCVCTLRFPKGYAHIHLSWTAGCRKIIYTLQGETGACKVEEDMLEITNLEGKVLRTESISSKFNDTSHVGWFHGLFNSFRNEILNKNYCHEQLIEALMCMRVIQGVYTSSQLSSREVAIRPYG